MNNNVFSHKTTFSLEDIAKETVEGLYTQLEQAGLFLRSWHFPSRELVVRTSDQRKGPLRIDLYDFRAGPEAMVTVIKEDDQLVTNFTNLQSFGPGELKVYMKGVLRMHEMMPKYDPMPTKAPVGFCAKPDPASTKASPDWESHGGMLVKYPDGDKE